MDSSFSWEKIRHWNRKTIPRNCPATKISGPSQSPGTGSGCVTGRSGTVANENFPCFSSSGALAYWLSLKLLWYPDYFVYIFVYKWKLFVIDLAYFKYLKNLSTFMHTYRHYLEILCVFKKLNDNFVLEYMISFVCYTYVMTTLIAVLNDVRVNRVKMILCDIICPNYLYISMTEY